MAGIFEQVYEIVRQIPEGSVASYGQIAVLAGRPRAARTVGWALHALEEDKIRVIPWHRVINSRGEISTTCHIHHAELQAKTLHKEGVKIKKTPEGVYKIDMSLYGWVN